MDEVKGEVALRSGVMGSVWKKGVCLQCPPPVGQAAVCLSGPVGA